METGGHRTVQEMIEDLDAGQQAAVFALWADELARGWVPKRADLEAAAHLVRADRS